MIATRFRASSTGWRSLAFAALAAIITPASVGAQVVGTTATTENPAKAEAYRFEMLLRAAVEDGGRRLAREALLVAPELRLEAAEPAVVDHFLIPGYGYLFAVQAPNITSTAMVWDMYRRLAPPGGANPVRPVSDGRVGAATAPVEPDPMAGDPKLAFEPNKAYTNYVREALMEAILDSAAIFQDMPADQSLTVAASGINQQVANPLYRGSSDDKMLLTIKGQDLTAFRQGRITRDEAKQRITLERSF
jgi:hypothetical protein